MDMETVWREWVGCRRPRAPDALEVALRAVSAWLAESSEEVVVPLMTWCRAFPQIVGVVEEYRRHGAAAPKVCRFFDTAPPDVRAAFNELLVQAM